MKNLSIILLGLLFATQISAQNLKTAIASIGCKQIAASELLPTVQNKTTHLQWLKDEFGIVGKSGFIAKCLVKGTFYRFLFEEEIFENGEKAADRLKNLQRLPTGEHDKSDYAVAKILGTGFVRGKKIYTVGTFALFLEADGHLAKLAAKLKRKII